VAGGRQEGCERECWRERGTESSKRGLQEGQPEVWPLWPVAFVTGPASFAIKLDSCALWWLPAQRKGGLAQLGCMFGGGLAGGLQQKHTLDHWLVACTPQLQ
jgi:hypothetical protein